MKTLTTLIVAASLTLGANLALAKDIGPDQALKLRDAGTIQSFEKLNEAALAKHPGAQIEDTELDEENGQYFYDVELRDEQGVQWDLELDAKTGEVLKDHQDD
ncbi:PepSY domain-containing protein [Pseudomonas saliphila]|uniref:PepSY domain-containing protein n=1 Tax=Pseudomonas saliphila TaxID=2586906 RepID=UPI00123A0F39|nr:PepSY domain-containing protein [Pseudomonas saliphila]